MDPPGRATAAQLANRKIKGAKGIRRTPVKPVNSSFPVPSGQQQTSNIPQGVSGSLASGTFGAPTSVAGETSLQQPQNTSGFGQQGGGPFGMSQSFPPSNTGTSSGAQQGSQSTSFSGFGTGVNGVDFGGASTSFSFTASSATNPFASSNGTAVKKSTPGMSTGFKGDLFSLPSSGDSPCAVPQVHPPVSNPFGFPQSTQTQQQNPFGQQGIKSQSSPHASNPFGTPKPQPQQPLSNIFGQQSNLSSPAQQSPSLLSQSFDNMQTSPDGSPYKPEDIKSNPFASPSPSMKPAASASQNSSKLNPFRNLLQPSTSSPEIAASKPNGESSNSLFSRISQPSTSSPEITASFLKPDVESSNSLFSRISQPSTSSPEITTPKPIAESTNGLFSRISQPSTSSPEITAPKPIAETTNALFSRISQPSTTSSETTASSIKPNVESSNNLFSEISQPSTSSPEITASKTNAESTNGLFSRISQPSTTSPEITASFIKPNVESSKSLFSRISPPSTPFTLSAEAKQSPSNTISGAVQPVTASTSTVPLTSTGPSTLKSSSLHFINDHKVLFNVPRGIPQHFTDAQNELYITSYRLRSLNASVKDVIAAAPDSAGYAPIAQSYTERYNEIVKARGDLQTSQFSVKRKADDATLTDLNGESGKKLKLGTSILQTSQSSGKRKADDATSDDLNGESGKKLRLGNSILGRPLATTPSGTHSETTPNSIFENQVSYPSLSEPDKPKEGSQTSNIFKNILGKTYEQEPVGVSGSTANSINAAKLCTQSDSSEVDKTAFASASRSSGMPVSNTDTDTATLNQPVFEMPKFGSGATDFMAQFTTSARETERKEREKRKADEFDSDDEDEEDWERKDAEQQRAKKLKIVESSKGKVARLIPGQGFTFEDDVMSSKTEHIASPHAVGAESPTKSSTNVESEVSGSLAAGPAPFTFGDGSGAESSTMTPSANVDSGVSRSPAARPAPSTSGGASVFDSKPLKIKDNIFGHLSDGGDHTFKHDSPIKFGSTAAPTFSLTSATPTKATTKEDGTGQVSPFTNLFGASKGSPDADKVVTKQISSTTTSSSKSTDVGFGFGGPPKSAANSLLATSLTPSTATSRASSPGATTDTGGESANELPAEGNTEESSSQLNLTNGGPGEEDEDVLYEVRAKALALEAKQFVSKGVGLLRVLKHRETGKVRILLRQDPNGKLIINAALMNGVSYSLKGPMAVSLPIPTEKGTLAPWLVRVGKVENATALAKVLEDHKSS